jgi:alpha-L-fucosidase
MTNWSNFNRELPEWYSDAKFGLMVSWGAFSVPAWGEPIGELGTIDDWEYWFAHNPYAEWYFNTIRIPGSGAAQYHLENFNGCPYDDLLDMWTASKFDPDDWARQFAYAGAKYIVPLSKHHDGITLWDAPGTGTRNTVHRGPKRDLIGDISTAVEKAGMRSSVYYSGGLDWGLGTFPPHQSENDVRDLRPNDAAYSMYAFEQVKDLIDRYKPGVLWNDIEWPDFSKGHDGPYSLSALFEYYYSVVPDGVVNDRWGDTHSDFKTSEYQHFAQNEGSKAWENCRGIGLSFGYNKMESEIHSFSPTTAIQHLIDVVSRGGNFLLNVGPNADGEIPEIQGKVLRGIGDWMAINSEAIYATRSSTEVVTDSQAWTRWTVKGNKTYLFVEQPPSPISIWVNLPESLRGVSGRFLESGEAVVAANNGELLLTVAPSKVAGPVVVEFFH